MNNEMYVASSLAQIFTFSSCNSSSPVRSSQLIKRTPERLLSKLIKNSPFLELGFQLSLLFIVSPVQSIASNARSSK